MDNPFFIANDLWARGRNGSGRLFEWKYREGGWTVIRVRKLLSDYGVSVYSEFIPGAPGRLASLRVNDSQADWAEGLIRTAGVPIVGPVRAEPFPVMPATRGGRAKARDPIGRLQGSMAGGIKRSKVQAKRGGHRGKAGGHRAR